MASGPAADVPARLATLLWSPTRRVGRTGLTLASVVEAAVELADDEGLERTTMRRLAAKVEVGTMTLYQYVPGRPELLELMLDRVAGEVYEGRGRPAARRSVRTAVRHIADCNWDHLMRHRWVVDIPPGRPVIGPGEVGKYELELEPFDGRGLGDHDLDALVGGVLALVQWSARWQISLERTREESGLTDLEWWQSAGPVLARHLDESAVPIGSRVGTTVADAGDPQRVLDFGLDAIVGAVEARLQP